MPTKTNNLIKTSISGWCGVGALLGIFFPLRDLDKPTYVKAAILIGVVYAVMFAVEAALCWRGKFGLIAAPPQRKLNPQRIFLKILGWILTVFVVSSAYWLFPEYSGDFYTPYYQALALSWPVLAVFFMAVILWGDVSADQAEDDYYVLGLTLIKFNPALLKKINLKQHILRWIVKLYFLPLMFIYLVDYLNFKPSFTGVLPIYDSIYNLIFLIDTALVSIGYIFANDLIDTQIRSTEPTLLGWACTLICYQPFWSLVGNNYLSYGSAWGPWLAPYPSIQIVWAVLIILFLLLYIWATISFGSRFSNLTHRGILVCGPYAYLKHPAYIGKMGAFVLMYIPFVGDGWIAIARNLIVGGLVAGVYFLRAKTEERHLRSIGPEYDLYAKEVAQNWKRLWARS